MVCANRRRSRASRAALWCTTHTPPVCPSLPSPYRSDASLRPVRTCLCGCQFPKALKPPAARRGGPHKRGVSPRCLSPPRKRVRHPPLLGLPYTCPYCSPSRSSPRRVSNALNNFTSEALCALRHPHPRPAQLHRRGGLGAARGARSVPVPTFPVPPPHELAAAAVFFPGFCSSVWTLCRAGHVT
jgi:hypothetical protein